MYIKYNARENIDKFFGMIPNKNDSLTFLNHTVVFNNKFLELMNYYMIIDYNEIYNFIKNNENIFEFLDAIKPALSKYFDNHKYVLSMFYNPENEYSKLALTIKTDYYNADELVRNLIKFNSEVKPLKKKLNLVGELLVDVE